MNRSSWIACVAPFALGIALAAPAAGVVTLGPGSQALVAGRESAELVFGATGIANAVSLFSFVIEYDGDAPYEPIAAEDGFVDCRVEDDLAGFVALVSFFPDRNPGEFIISFGDLTFPLGLFPRDGIIGRCPVRLKDGAEPGTYGLRCGSRRSAADAEGHPVEVDCQDGTLDITSVIVGPGHQRLDLGRGFGEFSFEATGVADSASLFNFVIEYGDGDPYEPVHGNDGSVRCRIADDLAESFAPLSFFSPNAGPGEFSVSFGDFAPPLINFPREGVIGACSVSLRNGARVGLYELRCGERVSAADAVASPLDAVCRNGTLEIIEACLGDSMPPYGAVTADEAVSAVLDFGRGDVFNAFADLREPLGTVTAVEANIALLNFGRGDCSR